MSGGQMQRIAIVRALSIIQNRFSRRTYRSAWFWDFSSNHGFIKDIAKETSGHGDINQNRKDVLHLYRTSIRWKHLERLEPVYDPTEETKQGDIQFTKTKMSFMRQLQSPFFVNNLLTKKGRTFLTAFAGSSGLSICSLSTLERCERLREEGARRHPRLSSVDN